MSNILLCLKVLTAVKDDMLEGKLSLHNASFIDTSTQTHQEYP